MSLPAESSLLGKTPPSCGTTSGLSRAFGGARRRLQPVSGFVASGAHHDVMDLPFTAVFRKVPHGRIDHHTVMPKTKVALTIDAQLLEQVDALVSQQRFRSRSQAIEAALADKLHRLARTRLAREAAKLDPAQEKRLADEGLADALDSWPEY
jgi:Arc/MetJ-type ribon-helix-helix transcriptional regulator